MRCVLHSLVPFRLAAISIAATFVATASAQTPVIGIWSFDETSGLVASDSGPLGNTGSLVGFSNDPLQWVPGRFGNALSFDGADDYVEIAFNGGLPFYDGLGSSFSVTFWVQGPPQNDKRVLSLGSATSNTPLFTIGSGQTSLAQDTKLRLYVRNDSNTSHWQVSDTVVFDDTWHHIAYVETAGRGRLYVDGVQDSASFDLRGPGPRSPNYGTYSLSRLTLGAVVRSSFCCGLFGNLDDMRIYGFELSAADVATVINGGSPSLCRASVSEFGYGCGHGPIETLALGSAQLGGPGLRLVVRGGTANSSLLLCVGAGPMAPLDLAALNFPGCTLYQSGSSCFGVGNLDASGSTAVPIPIAIPNQASLACLRLGMQTIALTPQGGGEFSNAVVSLLGH